MVVGGFERSAPAEVELEATIRAHLLLRSEVRVTQLFVNVRDDRLCAAGLRRQDRLPVRHPGLDRDVANDVNIRHTNPRRPQEAEIPPKVLIVLGPESCCYEKGVPDPQLSLG